MDNDGELARRVRHLIKASKSAAERQAEELVGSDAQTRTNVALRGWLTGMEHAVVELAHELERMHAAGPQADPSRLRPSSAYAAPAYESRDVAATATSSGRGRRPGLATTVDMVISWCARYGGRHSPVGGNSPPPTGGSSIGRLCS
jgi:hypothetical protein